MNNVNKIHFMKFAEFIRNSRFTPAQKVVFVDILLYAGVNGESFPSQQTLADNLGQTPRNVRYCLDMLCAAGLIKKKRRGFSKSNQYLISEEVYFRNGNSIGNSSSAHFSTPLPNKPGNALPPNVTQLNNSSNDLSEAERERARKKIQEIRETLLPRLRGGVIKNESNK